jgi:hypothetical protein
MRYLALACDYDGTFAHHGRGGMMAGNPVTAGWSHPTRLKRCRPIARVSSAPKKRIWVE